MLLMGNSTISTGPFSIANCNKLPEGKRNPLEVRDSLFSEKPKVWVNHGQSLEKKYYVYIYISGWWFGTWLLFFHILGISSSQLTFIFFRGVETTNQIDR